ncbi:hypothetical protein [Adhaeribacter aquaticus]|uniref:hypothetical protein n=1 Tax=Adhaeribacter aquaticus TaxID=299567 RepID=UPI0004261D07|nr:hypothetical protein [Adhaeribacter aquaticus]
MRKPLFLFAFLSLFVFTSYAQNTTDGFKPTAGDYTTEVNLNLFNNNGGFSLNQIRLRHFTSPTTALRLGFSGSFNSNKDERLQNNFKSFGLSINPGFEKHFAGTTRLSPYLGAELALSTSFAKQELTRRFVNYEVKNGQMSFDGNSQNISYDAYSQIGVNALAGVDYYFAKRFYAGIELGYGFYYTKAKDVEVKQSGNTILTAKGESNININPFVNNGLRVGIIF